MNLKELSEEINYKLAKLEVRDIKNNLINSVDILTITFLYNIAGAMSMMNKQLYDIILLLEKQTGKTVEELYKEMQEKQTPAEQGTPTNIIKAPSGS